MLTDKQSEFLKNLMMSNNPSGYEQDTKAFREFCNSTNSWKNTYNDDSFGNIIYTIGSSDMLSRSIMISGHIDEVGLQVCGITDQGLLHVHRLGGIDLRCLSGQEVSVLSEKGIVQGIIGKCPIHLEESDKKEEYYKVEEFLVDIGAENKEEALSMVSIGDPMVYSPNFKFIGNGNRIMSKGLDDKIGVFVSALVLERLSKEFPEVLTQYVVNCVATTQEELGLRGAITAARNLKPNISIDIDVTFATDEGRGSVREETVGGDIKLGSGPVIVHGPDKSREAIRKIKSIAKEENIPIQEQVSFGGTNTCMIQEVSPSLRVETVSIGIPVRNMHTPAEICDLRDVIGAIDIIYKYITSLYSPDYDE